MLLATPGRDTAVAIPVSIAYGLPVMASLWTRLWESLGARFSSVRWVEPSNDITRTVLSGARHVSLPAEPLYTRDPGDLVFAADGLANPAGPAPAGSWLSYERGLAVGGDAAPNRPSSRRPGRAA